MDFKEWKEFILNNMDKAEKTIEAIRDVENKVKEKNKNACKKS